MSLYDIHEAGVFMMHVVVLGGFAWIVLMAGLQSLQRRFQEWAAKVAETYNEDGK